MIFEGEAPETDDEIEEEENDVEKIEPSTVTKTNSNKKKTIVIDKTLQKHWNVIGNDLINFSSRRCANSNKQIQKINEQAANCFTNMQNVAARLNSIHLNLTQLEDSVSDLAEATKLIPTVLQSFELNIPNFQ